MTQVIQSGPAYEEGELHHPGWVLIAPTTIADCLTSLQAVENSHLAKQKMTDERRHFLYTDSSYPLFCEIMYVVFLHNLLGSEAFQ